MLFSFVAIAADEGGTVEDDMDRVTVAVLLLFIVRQLTLVEKLLLTLRIFHLRGTLSTYITQRGRRCGHESQHQYYRFWRTSNRDIIKLYSFGLYKSLLLVQGLILALIEQQIAGGCLRLTK